MTPFDEVPDDAVIIGTQTKLILSAFEGPSVEGWHSYDATLETRGLRATIRVHDLGLDAAPHHLLGLFEWMRREWKGWKGEKTWGAIEGGLTLSCTSDRTGHVHIRVSLWNSVSAAEWAAEGTLVLDVMERDHAVVALRRFFCPVEKG